MKFLLDQDVYANTAQFLKDAGCEVVLVSQLGLSQDEDEVLLHKTHEQDCIFVTRNKEFFNLLLVQPMCIGIIYLNILPKSLDNVHKELEKVLMTYSKDELSEIFVVVEATGHGALKIT